MTTRQRRPSRPAVRREQSRAFVIIAVLVIMGSAIFIGTAMLFTAQAEVAGAAGARQAAQVRSLAWSGLQAIVVQFDAQREAILRGDQPTLPERFEIFETPEGETGVVRLLAIDPDNPAGFFIPEAAKLDVNTIDVERLMATGVVATELAEAILAFRQSLGRPIVSIEELLRVEGMTPAMLYGDHNANAPDAMPSLADVLTVFAFEPSLQRNGRLRININVSSSAWSDQLSQRLDERYGQGTGTLVKRIVDEGTTFDSDKRIVQVLRFFQVPPADWSNILDGLTGDGPGGADVNETIVPMHFGRLDINRANEAALRGLPGVTPEQAAMIVRARENLSEDERATITWPLTQEILTTEQYDELVSAMTVRSWTYRVRFEARLAHVSDDDDDLTPSRSTDADRAQPAPLIWEAVIDLSSPRPRIAYLRDVTMLDAAANIAASASLGDVERFSLEYDIAADEPDDAADENDELPGPTPVVDRPAPTNDPPSSEGAPDDVPPVPPGRQKIGRWLRP
ncbi:MAG TPA: helix-hairpin-helix domain-containing protein [Phycisphaerales bacterium]|nr:helix-hairpin-helix domain-containing protein [Phycisphaerales bacterium]HRQ75804.1 helix-hairpin-helix domain-containing protein [Phycisphaerales bacterium]